jgi:HEPN domain-containing protein
MGKNRAFDWYKQAREDLLWARDTLEAQRFAQVCFISQQVGEKAIKALALQQGYSEVRSHSISEICRYMNINGELARIAKRLDQYYISTRYPDAFPSGAPFEFFTKEQAEEAVAFADYVLEFVSKSFASELSGENCDGIDSSEGEYP